MDQFIANNAWGILIGGLGLAINAGIIFATVKASIAAVTTQVANHTVRLNAHSEQIAELKINQAARMGYERAMRELRASEAS